jgi:hypothetical protein
MKYWQESILHDLISYFEPDEDVLSLFLCGSLTKPEAQPDDWSDIDILLVLKDGKIDNYFPNVEWLTHFGELYTYSQSADSFSGTTRACFENFNRIDLVITTEEKLAHWHSRPLLSGARVLFSRSKNVDAIVDQEYVRQEMPSATPEQFLELVRDFRFKSMLAVYKVVRNDLLIAVHLAQDLVRDCCVLGMMLRDRAAGTNIHKQGGIGNRFVAQLEVTQQRFTASGILDSIKASNEVFETFAREWSSSYQENRHLILGWIEKAKRELREENKTA